MELQEGEAFVLLSESPGDPDVIDEHLVYFLLSVICVCIFLVNPVVSGNYVIDLLMKLTIKFMKNVLQQDCINMLSKMFFPSMVGSLVHHLSLPVPNI